MAGKTQLTLEDGSDAMITRDGLQAEFNEAGVTVTVNGKNIFIDQTGMVSAEHSTANNHLPQIVLEVGDRLTDGTVCIAVDHKLNSALFAPTGIIGGKAKFDDQHEIPAQLNKQNAYGHDDWRNITDEEGKTLSQVWDQVAPDELKGYHAPWFWLASVNPYHDDQGQVRNARESCWHDYGRIYPQSVPVVRSGPAWN